LWTIWALSVAARLLVLDMNVFVNVEYRIMYGLALLSLTFYGVYMYAKRIKDLQLSESIMSLRAENLLLNFEQTNEYIHKVNSLKHDIKNHLTALHILVKDKKYDKAQDYLQKYVGEINEIAEAAYHSNYLINAVVHDLIHRAKSIGVKVKLNLKASPVSISEPDIIGLLTNITDNAIEACAKLPKGQEGFISLSITRREPYFAVVCENSNPGGITTDTVGEEGKEILTSKTKSGHGYGIKIIERIAASYGGMAEVSYNEEVFTITAILKDKQ
jgi:sensor histidine kinase regulating citrate/malate metabolism